MLIDLFAFLCGLFSAAALVMLALRCVGINTLQLRAFHFSLKKPMALSGDRFTSQDGVCAVLWALGALVLTYGVSLLHCGIFDDGVTWSNFCSAWQQYDAYHYLRLAEQGYANYTEGGRPLFLVFFPLYPWLMRLLHLAIPSYALCGHILSSLCYIGSCYLFTRLVTEEFGRSVGRLGLLFLTAYPFSFFFASIHTESLFLLLSLACFYFIRRHNYPLAGLLGALAALTRMQGVFLAVIAFVEYCHTEHPLKKLRDKRWDGLWTDLWGKLFWMAVIGLGTLTYLILNYVVTGSPFSFMTFQRERWYQGFALFTESLTKLWHGFLSPSAGYEFAAYTTWGPQILLFVFCLVFLFYGVRRLPPVWTLYYAICVFLNFSLSNPLSCCRYIACAFPLPVMLAIGSKRYPNVGRFLLLVCGVLQGVYMLAYFSGKHVC